MLSSGNWQRRQDKLRNRTHGLPREQLQFLLQEGEGRFHIIHKEGLICRQSFGGLMWRLNWQQTMTMLSSRSSVDVCFSACMSIFG